MLIGSFRKISQSRIKIPQDVMRVAKISDESEIYVCADAGENCIRIYPKEKVFEETKDE